MTIKPFSQKTDEEIYLEYLNEWKSIKAMAYNYNRTYYWMSNRLKQAKENNDCKIFL